MAAIWWRTHTHTQKLCENEEKLSKQLMHMIRYQNIYTSRAPGCGQPTLFFHFPIQFECVEAVKWYENKRSAYVVSTIKVPREPTLRIGMRSSRKFDSWIRVVCGSHAVSWFLTDSHAHFHSFDLHLVSWLFADWYDDEAKWLTSNGTACDRQRVDWKLFVFRTSTIATSCD